MAAEVPTPQITCRSDGLHYATCPDCDADGIEVPVSDVPIVVEAEGEDGQPIRVIQGRRSDYDLSAYEAHHREVHGDA